MSLDNYQLDHLGTPQLLTDKSGKIVWQGRAKAFGETRETVNLIANPLRFPGQYDDRETGMHYNLLRFYDASLGRYLTSDPIGLWGGLNAYIYVYNNPTNLVAPYGLWALGDPLPQGLVDFSAGFGDTISFGLTDWVRDQMGTNSAVNKCSGEYSGGEWAGIGWGFAFGSAGLARGGFRAELGNWKQGDEWFFRG